MMHVWVETILQEQTAICYIIHLIISNHPVGSGSDLFRTPHTQRGLSG